MFVQNKEVAEDILANADSRLASFPTMISRQEENFISKKRLEINSLIADACQFLDQGGNHEDSEKRIVP
jgi:hypothetical protein